MFCKKRHRWTTLCLCSVMTVCNLRLYIHATRSVEIFTESRYLKSPFTFMLKLSFKEMLSESRVAFFLPFRAVETLLWCVKPYGSSNRSLFRRSGNEMQFSDCIRFTNHIRTLKYLYDLYKPYGSSNRSLVAQVMRCNCQTVYVLRTVNGPKSAWSVQTVRIVKTLTRRSGNEMQLSDCIRTENCLYDPYGS